MATEQEIEEAEKRVDDKATLEAVLTVLAAIANGSGSVKIFIERDGEQFNFSTVQSQLKSRNANEDTMIAAVEQQILDAIGEDEITAGIRKDIRDLITLHEADIAAT